MQDINKLILEIMKMEISQPINEDFLDELIWTVINNDIEYKSIETRLIKAYNNNNIVSVESCGNEKENRACRLSYNKGFSDGIKHAVISLIKLKILSHDITNA